MKLLGAALCGLLALGVLSGCQSTGTRFDPHADAIVLTNLASVEATNRINPEWLVAPTNLFVLGPGDGLEIEVIGDPTTRVSSRVGPDGKIYFNLLPGMDVWGKTLAETRAALEQDLAQF